MDVWFIAFIILSGAVIAVFIFFRLKGGPAQSPVFLRLETKLEELSRTVFEISRQVDARLREATDAAHRTSESTQRVVASVAGQLGEQRQTLERIIEISQDIASLEEILKPPRARGALGEMLLENLLVDFLAEGEGIGQFSRQYRFKSGERVDFVLRLPQFLVPIDSKFPMEAFQRLRESQGAAHEAALKDFSTALKQHTEAIRKKYIMPDEGTADFAFMYIPSEGVYDELKSNPELVDYAFDRNVIAVSPNTFFAYIRTVLIGLRGMHIAASARAILSSLKRVEGEIETFGERFRTTGTHLRNAVKSYEEAERNLERLSEKLERLVEVTDEHSQGGDAHA